jgi:hypothetical protein
LNASSTTVVVGMAVSVVSAVSSTTVAAVGVADVVVGGVAEVAVFRGAVAVGGVVVGVTDASNALVPAWPAVAAVAAVAAVTVVGSGGGVVCFSTVGISIGLFAAVVASDSDGTGTLDSAVGVALFTGVSSTTGVDFLELLQPIA